MATVEPKQKNLQEKVEVTKVHETVKQIESNLSNSQAQIMEEAKKMTTTYADVSKVKETVNEMEKKDRKRHQDHKRGN